MPGETAVVAEVLHAGDVLGSWSGTISTTDGKLQMHEFSLSMELLETMKEHVKSCPINDTSHGGFEDLKIRIYATRRSDLATLILFDRDRIEEIFPVVHGKISFHPPCPNNFSAIAIFYERDCPPNSEVVFGEHGDFYHGMIIAPELWINVTDPGSSTISLGFCEDTEYDIDHDVRDLCRYLALTPWPKVAE